MVSPGVWMPRPGNLALFLRLCPILALAAGCHGKYRRPVSDEPIAATADRLQRGSYLVNQLLACGACHTSRATGNLLTEPERPDAYLGGGNVYVGKGLGTLWIPNITPDPETGIGRWKDDEILRGLRDGVAPDGHFLKPMMPYASYQHLSDEDAKAVVAYLRSVPPYKQTKPRQDNKLGFMQRLMFDVIGVQMHKPAGGVPQPDRTKKVEYGHYLVRVALCSECHSLAQKGPRPESDPLHLAGAEVPFEDPALGKVYAKNLTGDVETGLGRYDAAAIKRSLRGGLRLDGKKMASPMSNMIPHYSGLNDEDLDAMVVYLKSLPATKHKVPERELVEPLRARYGG
jgi:mono/diheme cytochrome c family protein